MNRRGFLFRVALGAGAIALMPAARVLGALKPLPVPPPAPDFALLKQFAASKGIKPLRIRGQDQYVLMVHPEAAKRYGFRDGDTSYGFRLHVAGVPA